MEGRGGGGVGARHLCPRLQQRPHRPLVPQAAGHVQGRVQVLVLRVEERQAARDEVSEYPAGGNDEGGEGKGILQEGMTEKVRVSCRRK